MAAQCPVAFPSGHRGDRPAKRRFFTDTGASLQVRWPARPLMLGRWGWSDPGTDAVLTGVSRLEAGERLGDLVLAAEQRLGAGRVLVLGDAFPLTNEGGVRGYGYTGRLLSYLAHGPTGPQSPWRQAATRAAGPGLVRCRDLPAGSGPAVGPGARVGRVPGELRSRQSPRDASRAGRTTGQDRRADFDQPLGLHRRFPCLPVQRCELGL